MRKEQIIIIYVKETISKEEYRRKKSGKQDKEPEPFIGNVNAFVTITDLILKSLYSRKNSKIRKIIKTIMQ